ncbi:MAG: trigger factor family protein, partial [Actinomycetota bacterium]
MKAELTEEGPTKRRLDVEVPAEEITKLYDEALRRLSREVKIPGFRPGKAPRSLIESRVGKQAIR